jgi:hypothetical protein
MSFEECFRHFSGGAGALPMISQKPSIFGTRELAFRSNLPDLPRHAGNGRYLRTPAVPGGGLE